MSTVESASNQKVGISLVCYNLDHKDTRSVNSELRNSLPVRFASLHLCINDEKEYQLALGALKALHSKSLVRYRSHFGTHEEVQHELASFGIHKNAVPVTENGHMIMVHHETWLNLRRKIEQIQAPRMVETNTKMAANFTPRPDDVLFGRGKLVGEHPGNTQFRQMVDFYTDKYESSGKVEKTCIAEIIVRAVKDSSACFLKKDEDGLWEEVDDAMARRKVAHAFRNRRMISRATQESSSKISSAVDYELQSKEVRMKNKNEKRRKK